MPARRNSKESQKRCTATEHAKQPVVLTHNPETQEFMEEAIADRADDSRQQLTFKLNGFLTYVVQEMYPFILHLEFDFADIEDMVLEKVSEWERKPRENAYNHYELLLHKKIWDVVNCHKDDSPKDHDFVDWCRRIALSADSAATEHADPFRMLVEDICANELTPSQRKKSKYTLCEDSSISTKLRSVVHVILRKNLGDARVATYILKHGVPTLLDPPWFRSTLQRTQMDSMLEEFLEWHASLLKWLSNLQNDPNMIVAQKLSDLNQKEWQAERRRKKSDIEQQLRQGALLANLRNTHAKHFHDMSATEQRVLEDYETGKLRKRLDEIRIRKPNQQAPPDHPA